MTDDTPDDTRPPSGTDAEAIDPAAVDAAADDAVVETRVLDDETFATFEQLAGMAAVGVTRDDGAVLLWEGPRGWTLPFTPVAEGESWGEAGRTVIEELTGVTFELKDVETMREVENERESDGETVTTREVVFAARRISEETAETLAAFEADADHPDVEWFDSVPEDADAVGDIQRFLD